jgi:hypothetical protein
MYKFTFLFALIFLVGCSGSNEDESSEKNITETPTMKLDEHKFDESKLG